MTLIAYAWASGLIQFGKKLPKGALPIITGQENEVRETIDILARHSRTNNSLLVPGIPEAANQHSAMDALIYFSHRAKESYSDLIKGGTKHE
ncbi:TPA: host nuclease inhibitor protein [Yersinia enterocolitica]|nr:host nuclease inhibitor protein [Yersinia enterocolitica]ELY5236728.1 host nuclease inhibitor protein [Yersinia enterocolitica]